MSDVARIDITIIQGATYRRTMNWYGAGLLCKDIESMVEGCPTILGVTGHGMSNSSNTPVFIHDVKGATNLNKGKKSIIATYVDPNTISVNVSTNNQDWVDGTGSVTYYVPTDLTGYDARMQIRSTRGATSIIHEMSTAGIPGDNSGDITLTAADGGINLLITADDTAAFDFDNAVYDIELINTSGNGDVTRVAEGTVKLHREVTR